MNVKQNLFLVLFISISVLASDATAEDWGHDRPNEKTMLETMIAANDLLSRKSPHFPITE